MTVISVGDAFGGVAVRAGVGGPVAVGVVGAVALLMACAVPAPRQRSAAWAADGASGV